MKMDIGIGLMNLTIKIAALRSGFLLCRFIDAYLVFIFPHIYHNIYANFNERLKAERPRRKK